MDRRRSNIGSTGARETSRRPLRIFPFDPMVDRFRDPVVSEVPFEHVELGPAGRLVEVVDFDSAVPQWLPPLDLDSPDVLIAQGLTPSESDFRFHQQMTYAVAMRVLEAFERGLGRPLTWPDRLRLVPHAFREGNAFFDPELFALKFGYFEADTRQPRGNLAGQRIMTCLHYDVVAHEVCHPVMWRMRPPDLEHWNEEPRRADLDTVAFHEGMADLVALFARFGEPDVVAGTIREHGADLTGTPLLRIAMQFGTAINDGEALRQFPGPADPAIYAEATEPHHRGTVLTSAFVEAFLGAYRSGTADLLRMSGGPPTPGNVHPDLVRRLTEEAAGLAARVLRSAIAAMDYLPPVGLRFYDVLRAVLATDTMLFGRTNHRYRSMLIESCHRRGLIPAAPGSLAADTLMLQPTDRRPPQRLPHAGDLLLHTVTAVELRRQFMVHPSRRVRVARELRAQQARRDERWTPAIAEFLRDRARDFGLDRDREIRVTSMAGSNRLDSAGNLLSRVFVTAVQDDADVRRRRGVTVVCDSDGEVQFVIGRRRRAKRRGAEAPAPNRRHQRLARSLTAADAGAASGGAPWTEQRIDRRAWRRKLRVLPFDPMIDRAGRSVIADVMYEKVERGPTGRLIQVIDYDAVHGCYYEPIDLDDPGVLLDCGLEVAESDPRFHQQMVYAVAMRVLETFERGLGRPFRWRGDRRLRIYPHAFVGENAYFDEDMFALLFGYFTASHSDPGPNLPGQVVFTALSHDIIAHETTHAVLKRLRPHYSVPTNPDVLAFHEGFADIIAILQHFTYPEVVAGHIDVSRSDLADRSVNERSPLFSLASQFGYARGDSSPLRTALERPDRSAYVKASEEHDRGAVLAAAVIDGFLRSYQDAIADLVRIATAGTGVLQPGALHPDLVQRIAGVVCRTAERITQICVRAFDYLPPVDITFSDYLRAMVTADIDLFPDDVIHLRANLIESFRARGIFPSGVVSLAERSLRMEPVAPGAFRPLPFARDRLLDAAREFDRRRRSNVEVLGEAEPTRESSDLRVGEQPEEWAPREEQQRWAQSLHAWALRHRTKLGLARHTDETPIAVEGFFTSQRIDGDGYVQSQITVQFVQRHRGQWDELGGIVPIGGVTVVADGEGHVRYVIGKELPTAQPARLAELRNFAAAVENRVPSIAWNPDPTRRIVEQLNLRSIDATRRA